MAAKLMLFERMQRGKRGLVASGERGKRAKEKIREESRTERLPSPALWGN
jgi:hypothetical protein